MLSHSADQISSHALFERPIQLGRVYGVSGIVGLEDIVAELVGYDGDGLLLRGLAGFPILVGIQPCHD